MDVEPIQANGVDGTTGEYSAPSRTAHEIASFARGEPLDARAQRDLIALGRRLREPSFAPVEGVEPDDLAQAGWGVVLAADEDPAVLDRLRPLLDRRRAESGALYREFVGSEGLRPGETKNAFAKRHGLGPGPVDPQKVPYYLLLVGDPERLPFRLQSQLAVQFAVGRLHFDHLDDYRHYAETVVGTETSAAPRPPMATLFGPDHDRATQSSRRNLLEPLATGLRARLGVSTSSVRMVDARDSTRDTLKRLLGGPDTPSVLLTASHGVTFPQEHAQHHALQGALLCQDWPGPSRGAVERACYFGAEDVGAGVRLRGLMAVFFACFGGGTPRFDEFPVDPTRPTELTSRAFLAALPKRLLAHPEGGALAVIGHCDRAWSCSFQWQGVDAQTAVFESALLRLLRGRRVGHAFQPFSHRYAELATLISEELDELRAGRRPDDPTLAGLWTAHADARNYVVLGDPATRLPADVV